MAKLNHTDGNTRERSASNQRFHPTMGPSKGTGTEADGELLVATPKTKPKRPPFYKVILLNDDYTPMDFVVLVLETIFRKPHEESINLMMAIHEKGQAVVAHYTRDVAETKTGEVIEYARMHEYPLQCVMEQE